MLKNPVPAAISLLMLATLVAVAPQARAQAIAADASPNAADTHSDYQVTRIDGANSATNTSTQKVTPQWLSMYDRYGTWPGRTMQW